MSPQFPIYIPSKGRAESRLTVRALEELSVPFYVVIEATERAAYEAVIDPARLLELDPAYQAAYDTFDALGDVGKGRGPGPARNFAWDHSIAAGFSHHWVMDDNIRAFRRLHLNQKIRLADGTGFRVMEDFALRYRNVAMSGPAYMFFVHAQKPEPPMILNSRIYSCNLIRNDVPFRWRGRYNEDTDLSLRMLKAGWCTVEFQMFLQEKQRTSAMLGGNTDEFYATEGTLPKSAMLVAMHPDVARLKWRFGRAHHWVDYRPFRRNALRLRDELVIEPGVDNYGMELIKHART